MTVASIEAAHRERYAQAREALWGKPRHINVIADEKRAVEAYRRAEREKWERQLAKRKAQEEDDRRWESHVRSIDVSVLATTGKATACFSAENKKSFLVVPLDLKIINMTQIALKILEKYPGVSLDDVKGAKRRTDIMLARRHVIAAIRIYRPDISLPRIGRFVNKDHSSCLHAIRKFAASQLSSSGRGDKSSSGG